MKFVVAHARSYAKSQGLELADADILLSHTLQLSRAQLFAYPERELSETQVAQFETLVQARFRGEPIAYLVGQKEFFGLPFNVDSAVLIPRPETELLVDSVLRRLNGSPSARVIDLGTGSGAIACALAHSRPDLDVWAVDASPEALALARKNGLQLGLSNVQWRLSDWFSGLTQDLKFDAIVSNPPYLDADDPHLKIGDLRFEPTMALTPKVAALDAKGNGLADLRHLIEQSSRWLKPMGTIHLEHGFNQGAALRRLMAEQGLVEINTLRDDSELERVTCGRFA